MTTQDQNTYEQLSSNSDPSFDEFYEIYTASIPSSERKQRDEIAAACGRLDYKILLVKRAGRVIGFSILFVPEHEPFCLLEYMAIHPACRNSGIGGALLKRTFGEIPHNGQNHAMLLEVESDCEADPDQSVRRRRLQFYKRFGCLRVDGLAYLLPLQGKLLPPPMYLLIYYPDGPTTIRKTDLRHWLIVMYETVYHCSPDDPRIGQMMAPLHDPVRLI